ncbi:MAG: lipid A export permease/ATP-binding protein MsbA [Gammaproteobacteria bacterium]|nr:lipid A export permease/ATP-binding protein MsbA [Gammaproteobacteria bacterium]
MSSDRHLYRRLLSYVRPYWKLFALSIIATIVLGVSEPAVPAIMGPLLDGSFVDKNTSSALHYSLLLVGLFLIRGIAQYISTVAMAWVGHKVVMDIRQNMFDRLLLAPTGFYDQRSAGGLLSKLAYDVTQVYEATTAAIVILVRDSVTVVGLLGFMLYTDWRLTIILFLVAPVVTVIVKVISKRLRTINRSLLQSMSEMNDTAEESILGHKEIKLFGGQAYEQQRFNDKINWVRRYFMKSVITATSSVPIVQLLTVMALAVIVNLAAGRQPPMSVGTFVAFFGAMGLMFSPIKRLTSVNDPLQRGLAAARTVFEVIDIPGETDTGSRTLARAQGKIEFRDINLRYPNAEHNALTSINLTIAPGETIALVGQSGGGKTTLVSLIPRFYQASSGQILIDDIDIQDLRLTDLRAQIGLVSQHVVLFDDTVAANIAYGGKRGASESDIIRAAEKAHAMEFIRDMPQGLHTLCGHNGVRLSGGQRQRIAIARALLKDAPILILDEATSALDTQSEQQVQLALEELMYHRTTIIIAHRLSTIKKANRIVVMDQGRIVETGSHAELLARDGRYAELYKIQFAGQE